MLAVERTDTPWRFGTLDARCGAQRLMFGRMFEDHTIEQRVLPRGGRIFCIASAGCIAIALAHRGDDVTAVDVNRVQIEYVRSRLRGQSIADGQADRMLRAMRHLLPWLGMSKVDLNCFLMMSDVQAQARFWHQSLSGARWRLALAMVLHWSTLRLRYGRAFTRVLPCDFSAQIVQRIAAGVARHSNRTNPYVWQLFTGEMPPGLAEPLTSIPVMRLVCTDAATFLEACEPGCFDGFSLSNILDAASREYRHRLIAAVRRAAADGAVFVHRSFAPSANNVDTQWAHEDRALLWGCVCVRRVAQLVSDDIACLCPEWQ